MKEWTLFHVNDFITLIMDFSLKDFLWIVWSYMIFITVIAHKGFPGGSVVKNLSANAGEDLIPAQEDLLD